METSNDEGGSDAEKNSRKREGTEAGGKGVVAQHVQFLEGGTPSAIVISPQKEHAKKRMKRSTAGGDIKNNPLFGSAPSDEEGDRVQ